MSFRQSCLGDSFYSKFANIIKVKVKVTLVQALRLCTGCTAHRGSRGIALPFLDHGTRRGQEVSVTPQPLFTPGKDPVPIVQEAGLALDRCRKSRPPPEFNPRTVQPVANCYTDYTTWPLKSYNNSECACARVCARVRVRAHACVMQGTLVL